MGTTLRFTHAGSRRSIRLDATPQRVLKDDARSRVALFRDDAGSPWVVKFTRAELWRRWLWRVVRISPGLREQRGAARLKRLGLRCAPPAARRWMAGQEVLVLPFVEAPTLAEVIRTGQHDGQVLATGDRLRLAQAIGRQMGQMTSRGIVNRDHKPSNLLIDRACMAGDGPVILDPDGLRWRIGNAKVVRMLALLQRAAQDAGDFRKEESDAVLSAMLAEDPKLTGRANELVPRIEAVNRARG